MWERNILRIRQQFSCVMSVIKNLLEYICMRIVKTRISWRKNKMKLGDIYVNKKDKSIIQIDSYATHMGEFSEKSIVIFRQMERHNTYEIGSVPSFNGYGSREEIESEYELLVPQEKLKNYSDWNEIFDMVENSR